MTRSVASDVVSRLESLSPLSAPTLALIEAASWGELTPARAAELLDELGLDPAEVVERATVLYSDAADVGDGLQGIHDQVGAEGLARVTTVCAIAAELVDSDSQLAATIWAHSLSVGEMAGEIVIQARGNRGLAWVLGVLHEVGRLAVLRVLPERMRAVERDVRGGAPLSEADRRHLGDPAARFASKAALVLGMPPALCALLAALETPELGPAPEVVAVAAADRLAPLLGHPVLRDALGIPLDDGLEQALGLDSKSIQELAVGASRAAQLADGRPQAGVEGPEQGFGFDALLESNRRLARLNADYERTRRELERRVAETRSLVQTFASLTMGLDAQALRYSILESLLEHYEAEATFLVTCEEGSSRLDGVAFCMNRSEVPEVIPVRIDLSRFDRETRQTLLQGAAVTARTGPTARLLRAELQECALFCLAPIMARGIWSGILGLAVGEGHEETAAKGEFLNILATAAALGMENARLYGEVLQQATIDPLTGVATRRVVVEELEELSVLEPDEREPFGVLLVDLDNFKAVNDTLGHQAGDQYLQEMAAAMRLPLRTHDSAGRYGGDEFLVILRDVSLEETQAIAERVRGSMESVATGTRWLEVMEPLGASVGVSWWDGGKVEAACLLAMADSSLYIGKSKGRNSVGLAAVPESF